MVCCAPLNFIKALIVNLDFAFVTRCTSAFAIVFNAFVNMFCTRVTFEGYETGFAFETVSVLEVQVAIIDCGYTMFLIIIGYYLTCGASATVA